ncbi:MULTISPECIES: hypothetical protein [Neisseria]|uniref:hypothetical protein n=1 Tax=Neisseria TaxID=482 RepID=UPI000E1BE027|nr:hypothetical protein [Neisseria dentiae]QMT44304.1 hypothetical protein H3L92_07375 [Neisseria dentiae]
MGGINHQLPHIFFSRTDEHQFCPSAFVARTDEVVLGVAPAAVIGRQIARWSIDAQYLENGIDESPVIY